MNDSQCQDHRVILLGITLIDSVVRIMHQINHSSIMISSFIQFQLNEDSISIVKLTEGEVIAVSSGHPNDASPFASSLGLFIRVRCVWTPGSAIITNIGANNQQLLYQWSSISHTQYTVLRTKNVNRSAITKTICDWSIQPKVQKAIGQLFWRHLLLVRLKASVALRWAPRAATQSIAKMKTVLLDWELDSA